MTINEKDFEDFIFIQSLENAILFNGKSNPKAILGKCISNFPEIKKEMQTYIKKINNIVQQVNNFSLDEQKIKLKKLNPSFFEKKLKQKKEKKNELIDLPDLEGEFIGRFAPAPSGYLHIGHALNIIYNSEYKKKYGGKLIIRFEDTNPEKINIKNYEKILEDINWLSENAVDEVFYQSERVSTYYKYLRQLVETGNAYICDCEVEKFKLFNDSSKPCPHRNLAINIQLEKYEYFFNGKYKDGDAVIRFKADLENKNPALRDFPIARLNSTPHARVGTKYKLWPMYNFAVSIDDSLMGINYIIRGKDAEIGAIRQDMIKEKLGLKKSKYYHFGLVQFTDIELGKTPIKKKIDEGIYSGWDDPRVPTLISFRKRGFKPKAFRDMIVSFGISKRGYKLSEKEYYKSLNYFNKQILEKESDRYFFVLNPKLVEIQNHNNYPEKEITLPRHPDFKDRGNRKFNLENKYYIDGIDFNNIEEGELIRLMHFGNFKVIKKTNEKLILNFESKNYDKTLKIKRNIHFIPYKETEQRKVKIIMQDASIIKGLCEILNNPKVDDSIQFERFGFVRYDGKNEEGEKVFYFTHR